MRKVVSALGVVALALTLGACGGGDKADEKAAEGLVKGLTGQDVDISDDGDTVKIKGDDGSEINVGGELPEELKDFPLPDDSKVISSLTGGTSGDTGSIVSIAANGDFDEVAAGLQKGLEDQGFTVEQAYSMETEGKKSAMYSATGNGRAFTVTLGEDDTTEGFSLMIRIMTGEDTTDTSM